MATEISINDDLALWVFDDGDYAQPVHIEYRAHPGCEISLRLTAAETATLREAADRACSSLDIMGQYGALTHHELGSILDHKRRAEAVCDDLRALLATAQARFARAVEVANRADETGELSPIEREELETLNGIVALARQGQEEMPV
jgi:hypothetical protein